MIYSNIGTGSNVRRERKRERKSELRGGGGKSVYGMRVGVWDFDKRISIT